MDKTYEKLMRIFCVLSTTFFHSVDVTISLDVIWIIPNERIVVINTDEESRSATNSIKSSVACFLTTNDIANKLNN